MTEKIDPAREIPEDVIEKAARALRAAGGGFFSLDAWRALARPAVALVWAAAREQALAEAEREIHARHKARPRSDRAVGGSLIDAYERGVYEARDYVNDLRRKEGGDA